MILNILKGLLKSGAKKKKPGRAEAERESRGSGGGLRQDLLQPAFTHEPPLNIHTHTFSNLVIHLLSCSLSQMKLLDLAAKIQGRRRHV